MVKNSIMRKWLNEYLEDDDKYENHASKFINYIEEIDKGDKPISIDKDDIIGSIKRQNEYGKINTYNSMANHLEAIKSFYKYLVKKERAEDIFSTVYDYEGFKDNIADKFSLRDCKEKEYMSVYTISSILTYLDDYIMKTSYIALGVNDRKRFLNNLVMRIFIKIKLIIPVSRKNSFNIKISDFKNDFRVIEKNKINIKISNSLYRDIQYSLLLAKEIHGRDYLSDENIFTYMYGSVFKAENMNTWFCNILRNIDFDMPDEKDTYSVDVISKTSIYNMVHNLVNPALISQLCGLKISTLEREFYGGKIEVEYIDEKINQEINNLEYYQYI